MTCFFPQVPQNILSLTSKTKPNTLKLFFKSYNVLSYSTQVPPIKGSLNILRCHLRRYESYLNFVKSMHCFQQCKDVYFLLIYLRTALIKDVFELLPKPKSVFRTWLLIIGPRTNYVFFPLRSQLCLCINPRNFMSTNMCQS